MSNSKSEITKTTNMKDPENIVNPDNATEKDGGSSHFIRNIVLADLKSNKHDGQVYTRFPPEPNGYLHIGHCKSICLNFGIAAEFGGKCNLRFDDTNPAKEEVEYVESIQDDIHWLGFDWEDRLYYASDYFGQLFEFAKQLICDGKAYVCHLSQEQTREMRGTLTEPGQDSPYRCRTPEENMELFLKMKNGEFQDGECVLRAKIDMAAANVSMRDPAMFRIRKIPHHRTGDEWCIYPMYDFTHGLSDSIEGITHSFCTLEFEDRRPLYDWYIEQLGLKCHPQQIEFARLNLTYTVLSKRKLLLLVKNKLVKGWDDPRMPTIAGIRRRGYTPTALREFCERIGVSKASNSVVDIALLEFCLREELNKTALRTMAVLQPLKVTIENYPEGLVEELDYQNHPEYPEMGSRKIHFSKTIYIEKDDFQENPPAKFFRLAPGREVRLRYAYFIRCEKVIKDESGEVIELICSYDPASKGGVSPDGRKVKATLHWLSEEHSVAAEIRLYDHLFNVPYPDEEPDFTACINPQSLQVAKGRIEPFLAQEEVGCRFQFERQGYFCIDPDNRVNQPVLNRIVALKDSWAKISKNKE